MMAILIKQQLNFLDKSDVGGAHIDDQSHENQLRFFESMTIDSSAVTTRSSRARECKDSMSREERGLIRNPPFCFTYLMLLFRL